MKKEIIIKSLSLVNFKGIRELSVSFDERVTDIFGRNGSGKTTLFDAFTWLLFGKDSQDRKKFDLKTLDTNGAIIPQLPHEVSAIITVNGEEIKLCRRFTEKWVKRAGQTERVFTGNEEERFYNDVPCSAREYDAKIAGICNEDVFKFITNPAYFPSQSAEAQKEMLLKMAGSISDTEIAAGNADFEALLAMITGKTMNEFKKEIASKKSRLNAEIVGIPGRIDEKKRDLSEPEDWAAIESEIKTKIAERDKIESQMADASEAQRAADNERMKIQEQTTALRRKRAQRVADIEDEATADYRKKKRERDNVQFQIDSLTNRIRSTESAINARKEEIERHNNARKVLIQEWQSLQAESIAVNAEQVQFNESDFCCPTCHRQFDVEDIEAKEAEIIENFEKQRKKKLAAIAERIAANEQKGGAVKMQKQRSIVALEASEASIKADKASIEQLKSSDVYRVELTMPDVKPLISADAQLAEIDKKISELEAKSSIPAAPANSIELKEQRNALSTAIDSLKSRLKKRDDNAKAQARIDELETQLSKQSDEIAELERIEFTMLEFSKARSAAIEQRIDGLFSLVRFRWIAPAINGAEKETCEATLNGKPYSTCSNAERIIIGLDIINAICKSQGVYAPIFVDNAESVNDIIPMQSQVISLIVSRDEQLVIEKSPAQKSLFNNH
ncbi:MULTISPECIES: ATP-binding protein [Muribaculaceae]|uniref:Uncharacterized protein n=2 Tax=Muribaculaceae TaxID=2005473 RepID=A0A4Z0V172_9BACT|nr:MULTISPECIES: AAA family ATPase [Muribaculaceae]QCD37201.1 hypothetical protein E7746_14785 [Muribaculum gordoncarteri]TGG35126.1 hypothetical protein EZ315_15700 [Duncaniella freteri]